LDVEEVQHGVGSVLRLRGDPARVVGLVNEPSPSELKATLRSGLTTTHDPLVAPLLASERITLRNGSIIQLSTHARVQMVSSRHSRELHLYEGEVQISVARDDSRPFTLISGVFVVHDVGTQLLASSEGTGIRLLVLRRRCQNDRGVPFPGSVGANYGAAGSPTADQCS
jgi:FecR protein